MDLGFGGYQMYSTAENPFYAGWDTGWIPYPEDKKPMANPWKLLEDGQRALATGDVTPQEAQSANALLSLFMKPQNPILQAAKRRPPTARNVGSAVGENPFVGTRNVATETPGVFEATKPTQKKKGSGLTESHKTSATTETSSGLESGSKGTGREINLLDVGRAYDQIRDIPEIQEQREGIENMRELLAMSASGPQDFYSAPIGRILESEFGRKGAAAQSIASAQAPTPDAVQKNILGYTDKIQDDRANLSTRIADLIGKQKAGFTEWQDYVKTKEAQKDGGTKVIINTATDPQAKTGTGLDQVTKAKKDVRDKFDKAVGPANSALKFSKEIEDLVVNEGPGAKLAEKTVQTLLARARSEVGNLSYYEQAGTTTAKPIKDRLEAWLQGVTEGTITPSNKKEILGLIKIFRDSANTMIAAEREKQADAGAAVYSTLGLDRDAFIPVMTSVNIPQSPAAKNYGAKVEVIRKSDGKRGMVSEEFIKKNPAAYERVKK